MFALISELTHFLNSKPQLHDFLLRINAKGHFPGGDDISFLPAYRWTDSLVLLIVLFLSWPFSE